MNGTHEDRNIGICKKPKTEMDLEGMKGKQNKKRQKKWADREREKGKFKDFANKLFKYIL